MTQLNFTDLRHMGLSRTHVLSTGVSVLTNPHLLDAFDHQCAQASGDVAAGDRAVFIDIANNFIPGDIELAESDRFDEGNVTGRADLTAAEVAQVDTL
eukprot:440525-Hanusia_phi.AAC.1